MLACSLKPLRAVTMPMQGQFGFLGVAALFGSCWASCPLTPEEDYLAKYVDERGKLTSDGTIARQIRDGTYTADSLSLEMYTWWVQLGIASHGAAIENFVSMFQVAGMKKESVPAKEWTKIVEAWTVPMVTISSKLDASVQRLFSILQTAITSWRTAALALADPKQGGSTDFMKVAQKWRAYLPNRHTKSLLMVHEFITELKTNNSPKRLTSAYELLTLLLKSTQSYRYLFNQYYVHYLRGTVPHNAFFFASNIREGFLKLFRTRVSHSALWTPAPAGANGCTI